MIEIIEGKPPKDELTTIEVVSYPSPKDKSVTISTVTIWERLTVNDVVRKEEISFEDALKIAKEYASGMGCSRIYVDNRS